MSDDNIFRLGTIKGGKGTTEDENNIPVNRYVITDIDDDDFFGTGFMIFTAHHFAIMQDQGYGAVPVLVLPIDRVKAAEILPDDVDEIDL